CQLMAPPRSGKSISRRPTSTTHPSGQETANPSSILTTAKASAICGCSPSPAAHPINSPTTPPTRSTISLSPATSSSSPFHAATPPATSLPSPTSANYSVLSACIGSSRDAFHAGTMHASIAIASSVTITTANTAGSNGCVSYSIDRINRTTATLPASPHTSPISAGRNPSFSTSP